VRNFLRNGKESVPTKREGGKGFVWGKKKTERGGSTNKTSTRKRRRHGSGKKIFMKTKKKKRVLRRRKPVARFWSERKKEKGLAFGKGEKNWGCVRKTQKKVEGKTGVLNRMLSQR